MQYPIGRITAFSLALSCSIACSPQAALDQTPASAEQSQMDTAFSPRPTTPRIDLVDPDHLDAAQAEMLASRPDYNIYKTLAHHPELYARWSPLGRALLNNESISPRHREIAMLRMGWLCQSEYEWAQHARIAHDNVGMSEEEIHRIAEGADAVGWSDVDRAVIRMADELRYDAMISDETWAALNENYSEQQVTDLLFTAAQYQLVSMALNSLGVQLDPDLDFRLPDDLPLPAIAGAPSTPRLSTPRLLPLEAEDWSPEQSALIQQNVRDDGSVFNIYKTLIRHPALYGPRYSFGSYIRSGSGLDPRTREMLILRTAVLIRADYEWGHHVPIALEAGLTEEEIAEIRGGSTAGNWSEEDRAILRAAEDLRREAFISDAVWETLSDNFEPKQLVEIIFTVGGYTMTGLALNSFGVQLEPGFEGIPSAN